KKLLDVLIRRVELLTGGRDRDQKPDWEQAIDLARSASSLFPSDEDKAKLARPVVQLIEQALKSGRTGDESFREGLKWLRTIEEAFPRSPAIKPISDRLAAQAKSRMTQAPALVQKKKLKEAKEILREAELLCPNLPGLRGVRVDVDEAYQILRVGVRRFPLNFSPALARNDAEKQALDLLFESLVALVPEPGGGR